MEKIPLKKKSGMYSVQVAMLFPMILIFIAICYDYMLYLNFKSAFFRTMNEFELLINKNLNLCPTECINSIQKFTEIDKNIRNSKSLFDQWHMGMDYIHLEKILKKELVSKLKLNLDEIERMEIKFKNGFFKNKIEIQYKVRANGLFRFSKGIRSILGDFRVLEGSYSIVLRNYYSDIINIDLIVNQLKKWDELNEFIDNINLKIDRLKDI